MNVMHQRANAGSSKLVKVLKIETVDSLFREVNIAKGIKIGKPQVQMVGLFESRDALFAWHLPRILRRKSCHCCSTFPVASTIIQI